MRGARDAVLDIGLPVEIGRELDQAAEALFALAHHRLGLLPLHELAELACDDDDRLDQALVGQAYIARGGEREDADRAALGMHRADEGRSRAHGGREPRARIGLRVWHPERLAGLPRGAHQPYATRKFELAGFGDEAVGLRRADAPCLLEAHLAAGRVDREIAAAVPAFGFADRTQHALQHAGHAIGLGKHAGNGVLESQALLGMLLLGDVAANAAIALESFFGVEDRLAADRQPAAAAARRRALHLEIAERLVTPELRAMRGPVGLAQGPARLVPAPGAERNPGGEPRSGGRLRRHEGEPELDVLLPVPVGGKLGEAAEALLAV